MEWEKNVTTRIKIKKDRMYEKKNNLKCEAPNSKCIYSQNSVDGLNS